MEREMIMFAITFLEIFLTLLYWCIFIWVLMSWFASAKSPLGQWLDMVVRPVLRPFRFARIGMLDFSPIVALIVIRIGSAYIIQALLQLAG